MADSYITRRFKIDVEVSVYEFSSWSNWGLNSSCSPTGSVDCVNSGDVGNTERECQCRFTDWSSWSVTNGPISAINNSCSDGAVQQEVARETRSCTYESTPIYGCNTGAWSSWSNVSSCTSSYGTGACGSTLDRQCRTINTCSCTAWSAYQDWTSGNNCSNQGNSCGTELECSSRTQCSTCYACSAGGWSAWSNVSSCTTSYGTGSCSSTVDRECRTVTSSSCTWEVIQTQYPGTCASPNSPACSDGVIWYEQRYAGSTPFCLVQRGVVTTTSQRQQRTRSTSTYSYSCNCYTVPTFRTRNCTGNPNQRQQQTRTTTQVITGYNESCNCGSWQSFTNVSSCDEVNDSNGCQTQRCQSRSRVGFTESRTRTCTETTI